jgi:hypothetical protein
MNCDHCGEVLPAPKRGQQQRFCTARCRVASRRALMRNTRTAPYPMRNTALSDSPTGSDPSSYGWGKVGDPILNGDDYQLEYYPDGYPKLPDCLRRIQKGGDD